MGLEAGEGSCKQREGNKQTHRSIRAKAGLRGQLSVKVCWSQGCMAGWACSFGCPSGINPYPCSPCSLPWQAGWVSHWEVPMEAWGRVRSGQGSSWLPRGHLGLLCPSAESHCSSQKALPNFLILNFCRLSLSLPF